MKRKTSLNKIRSLILLGWIFFLSPAITSKSHLNSPFDLKVSSVELHPLLLPKKVTHLSLAENKADKAFVKVQQQPVSARVR